MPDSEGNAMSNRRRTFPQGNKKNQNNINKKQLSALIENLVSNEKKGFKDVDRQSYNT